ncbi:MAG: acyltransferase [Succinivibrio sp.]|nr:acyltransferase [Succinivibrio sp.]
MFLIVAGHFAFQPKIQFDAFKDIEPFGTAFNNIVITQAMNIGSKVGVFLFGALSGYFLLNRTAHLTSLLRIVALTVFYSGGFYILAVALGKAPFDIWQLFINFMPVTFIRYWFITAYVLMILCSPLTNAALSRLTQKQHLAVLLLFGVLWYLIPTLLAPGPLHLHYLDKFFESEFLALIYAYVCGAYIRRFCRSDSFSATKLTLILAGSILCQLLYILAAEIHALHHSYLYVFWFWIIHYNSVFTLINAWCVFLLFLKIPSFHSPWVNRLATCMLGVYLLHDNTYVKGVLWRGIINPEPHMLGDPTLPYLCYIAFAVVSLFCVCTSAEFLRSYLTSRLSRQFFNALKPLDRYFEKLFPPFGFDDVPTGSKLSAPAAATAKSTECSRGSSAFIEEAEQNKLKEPGRLRRFCSTVPCLKSSFGFTTLLGAASLIFALLVETLIFNGNALFFNSQHYPEYELKQQLNEKYGRVGFPLTKQYSAVVFSNLNLPAQNVRIDTWAPVSGVVRVKVFMHDAAYKDTPVCDFLLNPGGSYNSSLCRFRASSNLRGLKVEVEPSSMHSDVLLTTAVINHRPSVEFSPIHLLVLFLLPFSLGMIWRFKLYTLQTDFENSLGQRLALWSIPVLALIFTLHIFNSLSPKNTPEYAILQPTEIVETITPKDHSLTVPLPDNYEELRQSNRYTILFHALLHGHLYLDLPSDPKLLTLENPYSAVERSANGVKYFFDYSWYKGRYFSYFGIAPLLLTYLPVYALTGEVPTLALSGLILTVLALLSICLALHTLFKVLVGRCNLLLLLGTQTAVICSSGIWLYQTSLWEYNFPYLSAFIFLSLAVTASWRLLEAQSPAMQRLCLLTLGFCVPLVVMSRPHMLLFTLALCLPPLGKYYIDLRKANSSVKTSTLKDSNRTADGNWSAELELSPNKGGVLSVGTALLLTGIPVILGAIFVMWYNYVRFDSVFEFGQKYCLNAADVTNPLLTLSLSGLCDTAWYFFLEPLDYLKNFPFITSPAHNYGDNGGLLFFDRRAALFTYPLFWSLLLLFFRDRPAKAASPDSVSDSVKGSLLRLSAVPIFIFPPLLAYFVYLTVTVVSFRYIQEWALPTAYICFVLLLRNLRFEIASIKPIILSLLLSIFLARTILQAVFLPFSIDQCNFLYNLNPDLYLYLSHVF